MSVGDPVERAPVRAARVGLARLGATLRTALFGDRVGLALFLATLAFAGLYWRLGFFITDNYTVANGLVAVADGGLAIEEATYGSLNAPGTVASGGSAYARNYGQIVLALPFLRALEGLALVADPGVAFPALWCLVVLALTAQVGAILDRRALGAVGGSALALALFAANLSVARPIDPGLFPLAALQLGSTVAAGFGAVLLYRLLAGLHGRRTGIAAGALTAFATPIGFWAPIPKRHALTAALVVAVCYAFSRSRTPGSDGRLSATGMRALAYAFVGLLAWVHAPEAIVVFAALVVADVPTAPANDRRTLATVAAVFLLSLVPFFVTNVLLSGNPLRPPRLLSRYGGGSVEALVQGSGGAGTDGGGSGSGGDADSGIRAVAAPVLSDLRRVTDAFAGLLGSGFAAAHEEPRRLVRSFVRGGYIDGVGSEDGDQAIYLTVAESAPVVAGTVAALVPVLGAIRGPRVRRIADRSTLASRLRSLRSGADLSPARSTDLFVCLVALLLTLVYLPRLPVHAQVTVRYLLPLYPLFVYAIARQRALRRVLDRHGRLAAWTWAGGVLLGSQVLVAIVVGGAFGRGEAVQVHAVLGLLAAVAVASTAVASTVDERADPLTAIAFGVAAALGTDFLLVSGLAYFQYGQYALPISEWLATFL